MIYFNIWTNAASYPFGMLTEGYASLSNGSVIVAVGEFNGIHI